MYDRARTAEQDAADKQAEYEKRLEEAQQTGERLVREAAQHITVLNFGTVLAQGTPDVALNDPEVIKAYIGG